MLKIRRSHDRLIFNMWIPLPGKDGLYIETGPWCPMVVSWLHRKVMAQSCVTLDVTTASLSDVQWLHHPVMSHDCITKWCTTIIVAINDYHPVMSYDGTTQWYPMTVSDVPWLYHPVMSHDCITQHAMTLSPSDVSWLNHTACHDSITQWYPTTVSPSMSHDCITQLCLMTLSHTPHCFEGVRIMFVNRPWAIHVL